MLKRIAIIIMTILVAAGVAACTPTEETTTTTATTTATTTTETTTTYWAPEIGTSTNDESLEDLAFIYSDPTATDLKVLPVANLAEDFI
ncbi:MAG: hypothetical protein V1761_04265, partial [bacterium]